MEDKKRNLMDEQGLRDTLDEIYKQSNKSSKPFYNLVELMLEEQTIKTAIHNIKSNKGSKTYGVDKKTIDDYLQMDRSKLISLIKRHIKNYQPKPVKRQWIDKPNSKKKRPLGMPTMIDRIIQEIARIVIEPIAEAKFYHYSFGFRPYRSSEQAMAEILERIRRNNTYWVIEGDIKGYFDNINHNKLLATMWNMGIRDKRLLMIIKKMLKAGVMEGKNLNPNEVGTPQGGIISPLLANIYLNNFDWMIAEMFQEHEAKYKVKDVSRNGLQRVRQRHEDIFIVRYADDWVVLCQSEANAKRVLKKIDKYFNHKLGLELSKEKTLITDIREKYASFLGFWIKAEPKMTDNKKMMGKAIPNMDRANAKVREILDEIRKIHYMRKSKEIQIAQIERVNSMIVGLAEYYKIANVSQIFKSFDHRIFYQAWRTWLRLNNNRGRLNKDFTCYAKNLVNRKDRHKDRLARCFFIEKHGVKVGITHFEFTAKRNAMKVNILLSPYTNKGRAIYKRTTGKKGLLPRSSIFDEADLFRYAEGSTMYQSPIYNFEYFLNRDYAYNRDYGKCKCCGEKVDVFTLNTHHIRPYLPLNKVNKVNNLATLCKSCHKLIHNNIQLDQNTKRNKKIKDYRGKLSKVKVA